MRTAHTFLLASACILAVAPAASAKPLHHRHRIVARAGVPRAYVGYAAPYSGRSVSEDGGGFNAGAAQIPPRGTYDGYQGPGGTVLRRSLDAQHEPGVAQELAPDAKQTATGGPSGGLPGFGGGR